ncbi:hypothetical protein K435DRAFT_845551 [Dendrothele bispora CBS 962.96]|uniref:Uncharacterized protein n=1 Tax=Dendrothele bispora (strain CBS 962.96) TaxID=1314807 RepID=A0A4S8KTS5_DENBC|nr:hypothetical protein K435DRAFT_845551 [Dendrothele bispora CBS 962.96]
MFINGSPEGEAGVAQKKLFLEWPSDPVLLYNLDYVDNPTKAEMLTSRKGGLQPELTNQILVTPELIGFSINPSDFIIIAMAIPPLSAGFMLLSEKVPFNNVHEIGDRTDNIVFETALDKADASNSIETSVGTRMYTDHDRFLTSSHQRLPNFSLALIL